MDIKRAPPKKTKQYIMWAAGIVGIVAVSIGVANLKPAAPTVEKATLWIDSVRRGEMKREVHAPGTLVPEQLRIVAAVTAGRVEELPVRPGVTVDPATTIVVLSNTDVELQALQSEQQLTQTQSALASLRTSLLQQRLAQEGQIATVNNQLGVAKRNLNVQMELAKKKLTTEQELSAARDLAEELETRLKVEKARLTEMQASEAQQIQLMDEQVRRLRAIVGEQRNRVGSMRVLAGASGQLQTLGNPQLEVGQWVNPGLELARIAQPGRLKAVLRVPETQAKDIVVGQKATIDLHNNGIIDGHVMRTDPSSQNGTVTVEVALDSKLPDGARSDLSVDGTIEIERLKDVMYVGRPAYGQAESTVGLFKLEADGKFADRANVKLGRASVNTIEVISGLNVGDKVIISDMSAWDNVSRVKLK